MTGHSRDTAERQEEPVPEPRHPASRSPVVGSVHEQEGDSDDATEALIESFPASDPPARWAGHPAHQDERPDV